MFKRGLHANGLKISTILLILTVFAGSFVYAEHGAEPLLAQLKYLAKHNGDIEQAKSVSDQIIETWPSTSYALEALGEIGCLCAFKNDDAGVNSILAQLYGQYSAFSDLPQAIDRVAQGYLRKNNAAKAQAVYTEALSKMPNHPGVVWFHAGTVKCQILQNDFTQAQAGVDQLWSQYSSAIPFVACLHSVKDAYWDAGDY